MKLAHEFDSVNEVCIFQVTDHYHRTTDSKHLILTTCKLHEEFGYRRFLYDTRLAHITPASTLETYDAASPASQPGQVLRGLKCAMLYAKIGDDEHFIENVARNQGYTFRIFSQFDEAVRWLTT
jgi:hypothetical protein